ncbi:hypothetical protein Kpol_380p15 [Vanderwaltozyma polyspora DSM 70294]|uniref:Uncharacterized protein n=1 Tax=Vanderwaltozyma polyspora (strain ATCC 22028 / DSM 70294 / BCRC 21397 / CBS 2163 / NBRC 10782 / NRRL Y-8283 / UCD 57-17) TaxID=436907 RepID=A7TS74_VANPO|nr:uncharacterized protein Kpol_380p15 [Vanderwaltozyma polyspora DSM 70294]EDO14896.1 hypothetical protein Kpol_380p15 [Vanderwaltozyma polyspora DSM 70294]
MLTKPIYTHYSPNSNYQNSGVEHIVATGIEIEEDSDLSDIQDSSPDTSSLIDISMEKQNSINHNNDNNNRKNSSFRFKKLSNAIPLLPKKPYGGNYHSSIIGTTQRRIINAESYHTFLEFLKTDEQPLDNSMVLWELLSNDSKDIFMNQIVRRHEQITDHENRLKLRQIRKPQINKNEDQTSLSTTYNENDIKLDIINSDDLNLNLTHNERLQLQKGILHNDINDNEVSSKEQLKTTQLKSKISHLLNEVNILLDELNELEKPKSNNRMSTTDVGIVKPNFNTMSRNSDENQRTSIINPIDFQTSLIKEIDSSSNIDINSNLLPNANSNSNSNSNKIGNESKKIIQRLKRKSTMGFMDHLYKKSNPMVKDVLSPENSYNQYILK